MPLLTLICFAIALAAIVALTRLPRTAFRLAFWLIALASLAGFLFLLMQLH